MLTKWRYILPLLAMVTMLIPQGFSRAENSSITITALYQDDIVVTLDISDWNELSTLDPQQATDQISITPVENLFHGLTDYDPVTTAVVPELATAWEVTEGGIVWTFRLRNDVLWYRYDPASDTADELRPVVAADVVYGIKRACDPRLGAYYGYVAASIIAGCDLVNQTPSEEVTDEMVFGDTIQVSAPDDTTLVIRLQFAAGYFFSMTPMWIFRPVHQETIEEFGDEWTTPGNIATNGPYFVKEISPGVRRVFVRNKNHNPALDYGGNIDVINFSIIPDIGTTFALYQDEQLDVSNVPSAELQNILENPDFAEELDQVFSLSVFYFGFAHDKPPFDNVHVRRAFSAIIDRQVFVDQLLQGRGVPMIHFTPPGMAHAVPINEVGVGFDPDYALAELEAAGYANCEGLPSLTITTYLGAGDWADFWASAAQEYLGCPPDLFTVEQVEFSVLLEIVSSSTATQDRPNAWTLGWGPDYGDAHNWVGDVLGCENANEFIRPCSEVDDLIDQAAHSNDPAEREQLYFEIEQAFFGATGEFPIAPIYMESSFTLIKPWYTGPFDSDGLFGGEHWDARSIDMTAKRDARGE